MKLKPLSSQLVDGENNAIPCTVAYAVCANDLLETLEAIADKHGARHYLLPLGGRSGGGGIFQRPAPDNGPVVGLQIQSPTTPRVRIDTVHNLADLALDEIVIDTGAGEICAGAGITLGQLNLALGEELGAHYKVLGADLTSYSYAQVGATLMTGGMGPQRRYFSDSVVEAAIYRDNRIQTVRDDALLSIAGSYGWSCLATAVRCRFHRLPQNEVAFAIPVDNQPARLAALLQALSPFCFLQLATGSEDTVTSARGYNIILGLEHVTVDAMQPMLESGGDNATTRRARGLMEKCRSASANGIIFVNGFSELAIEEFLFELLDDADSDTPTIAGIQLEHTEVFNDPEQMRELREAVPFAARTQAPKAEYSFKGHTDAVIRLNPERVEEAMTALWQVNCEYVENVQSVFSGAATVDGQILVYGHLNPYGVDPHNRITVASDDRDALDDVCRKLEAQHHLYLSRLGKVCADTDSIFIGGEKGAASEQEMFGAFGGPEQAPPSIQEKFELQSAAIRDASPRLNWRAMPPYIQAQDGWSDSDTHQ